MAFVNFFNGIGPFDELPHEVLGTARKSQAKKEDAKEKSFHWF
jgi:hypothetical protein